MTPAYRNPVDLGFDPDAVEDAWISLVQAADRGEFGGAAALIARGGDIALYRATGWAVAEPEADRSPMGADTVFDLASLTKVVATTPSILALIAQNRIGLDQPLGEIITEFGTEGRKAAVTIRALLTHSAGFRDWLPVFLEATGEQAYLDAFAATQPEWGPGTKVVYSDPSFITLGAVVHRVTGERIDEFARKTVFEPLGMSHTRFTPPRSWRGIIAATEIGNDFEARKGERQPAGQPWRSGLLRGEVHDGNAWYGFNGVAGHAGLFSTLIDLYRYAEMWRNGGELDGVRILPEALVAEATTNQTPFAGPDLRRGLGWRLPPDNGVFTPEDSGYGLGPRAYGHTGFTGTSLYVDPDTDLVVILLTNRVHPHVNMAYLETRAKFSAAITGAITA